MPRLVAGPLADDWRVPVVPERFGSLDIDSMPDLLCNDTMKIDPSVLRQLREERSWTQEHLAAVSGVSLRTIQRIEREGNASADSRLALAAAFGVDVATLAVKADPPVQPGTEAVVEPPIPVEPPRRGIDSFLRHLVVYLAVGAYLVYSDFSSGQAGHWVQWPLMGWGLGVLFHGLNAWRRGSGGWDCGDQPRQAALGSRSMASKVGVYLVMSAVFVGIDLSTTGRLTWAYYPILGWGAGLLLARTGNPRTSRS